MPGYPDDHRDTSRRTRVTRPILATMRLGKTMPKRVALAALRNFTTPAVRYPPDPRALFVLLLCVVVGVPLVFANATPSSIAAQLDPPLVVAWGLMLSGGSLMTLLGAVRQSPGGVILEQVGSVALGVACLLYGGAIWVSVGVVGVVPLGIVAAFGLASLWRWGQLQAYLRNTEKLAEEIRQHRDEDPA